MGNSKVIIGIVIAVAIVIGVFAMNSESSNNDVISETNGPGDQLSISESISLSKNTIPDLGDNSTDESPKIHVIVIGDKPELKEG